MSRYRPIKPLDEFMQEDNNTFHATSGETGELCGWTVSCMFSYIMKWLENFHNSLHGIEIVEKDLFCKVLALFIFYVILPFFLCHLWYLINKIKRRSPADIIAIRFGRFVAK